MFISFFEENHVRKQNSPGWDAAFCGDTSVGTLYFVCLCPIKRTPGLYGLIILILLQWQVSRRLMTRKIRTYKSIGAPN